MGFTDWTHDKDARAFYRVLDASLTPLINELFPSYSLTKIGLVTDNEFDKDEIELRIQLKKNGKKMPEEGFFNGNYLPESKD
jgi:hypothetical protein